MGLPPSEHDPAAVRELADQILSEARYDVPPAQNWLAPI